MHTNRKDRPFHLNPAQVKELVQLAQFNERDVFYDLGCGRGQVVIQVVKDTPVKMAVGVESDQVPYMVARKSANSQLTWEQLQRIDFWFGNFTSEDDEDYFDYDTSNATILYYSLHETEDDLKYYSDMFEKKHIRIITKDLPLVGYASEANRENDDCWFFLTKYPLTRNSRIRRRDAWAESVLGIPDVTIDRVYSYFGGQLSKRRAYTRKDVNDSVLELEMLVNKRF